MELLTVSHKHQKFYQFPEVRSLSWHQATNLNQDISAVDEVFVTHDQFMESQVKGDGLEAKLVELESLQQDKVRELGQVTGYELVNSELNFFLESKLKW